uniref:DNA replication licensing factor MCM5 n=1 Tax=Trichobilharzia regenti TaxID=157069 RepID=A0AA85J4L6_TRIRE|nr:unnamed protein product [Trichobilharzia regenti]
MLLIIIILQTLCVYKAVKLSEEIIKKEYSSLTAFFLPSKVTSFIKIKMTFLLINNRLIKNILFNSYSDPVGTNLTDNADSDEIPLSTLRRFIAYARERCGPRLSEKAAEKLSNQYVLMRSGSTRYEQETGKRCAIPITVRQLEAIIRISESLAKMRLAAFATESDVEEALRLFHVSTLEAAMTGSLEGAEGFTTQEEHDLILRVEKQLKKRFVIGSQVSEYAIVQDFTRQVDLHFLLIDCAGPKHWIHVDMLFLNTATL